MHNVLNYEDMRRLARRRLPKGVFEYVDRGSEDEIALATNRAAWDRVKLNPSVLVDVSQRSLQAELFGRRQAIPLIIAPTAMAGLLWHDGEVELAKAAAAAGIPFCVSTQSVTSIETIAAQAGGQLWFQLYIWQDRALTKALVERAKAAGAQALVITADTAIPAKREYNTRNGFGIPIVPGLRNGLDVLRRPYWLWTVLLRQLRVGGMPTYAHYPEEFRTKVGREAISDAVRLADQVTWEEVSALRRAWAGPLIIKGIMRADDARKAVACGADGIVVSNHGGRNLDATRASVDMLPRIVDEAGDRVTVLVDSGVRRGSDIVKALALGAKAVLIGRSTLYGIAVAGAKGATRMLDIYADEISRTMALIGRTRIADIARDSVFHPDAATDAQCGLNH